MASSKEVSSTKYESPIKLEPSDAPPSSHPRSRARRSQIVSVVGLLVALLVAAVGSFFQKAPQPYAPAPGMLSFRWWMKLIEINPGLRPRSADPHNVFFVSPQVGWAIG
jgi:hypothetical protein